jgi:hypothetical protein
VRNPEPEHGATRRSGLEAPGFSDVSSSRVTATIQKFGYRQALPSNEPNDAKATSCTIVCAAEQPSTLSPFQSQLAGSRLEVQLLAKQQPFQTPRQRIFRTSYSILIGSSKQKENWGSRSMQSQSVCKAQLFPSTRATKHGSFVSSLAH